MELLFQFGTQLENANTIWWDNSKNAGVLVIPWREKNEMWVADKEQLK